MRFARRLVLLSIFVSPFLAPSLPAHANDGTPLAMASAYPALFGTREDYSPDNSAFFKWTGALARFHAEEQRVSGICSDTVTTGCEPAEWRHLINALRPLDLRAKLDYVNSAINNHPYVPSMQNWNESNHWETPFEFFAKNGQCQDYALTKYLLLREVGVPVSLMRLVVLRDLHLGLDHAVIVVYVDGTPFMLDNQIPTVVPVDAVHHYRPYYSINEFGWWRHQSINARYASAN